MTRRWCAKLSGCRRRAGWFCLDTPNGPVWWLRLDVPMNHDHKIVYAATVRAAKLERSASQVAESKGLNSHAGARASRVGVFDEAEASANPGVFAAAEECLLLVVAAAEAGVAKFRPSPTITAAPLLKVWQAR